MPCMAQKASTHGIGISIELADYLDTSESLSSRFVSRRRHSVVISIHSVVPIHADVLSNRVGQAAFHYRMAKRSLNLACVIKLVIFAHGKT